MIIDVLDGGDLGRPGKGPKVQEEQKEVRSWITNVRKAGGDPIVVHGMSNAIQYVVDRVIERAGRYGTISALRFHGHGAPGVMGVAGGMWQDQSRHLSDLGNRRRLAAGAILRELLPYFKPTGRVELHGCSVGQGPDGRRLLLLLSDAFGVPVTAAVKDQYDSEGPEIYLFEGPVRTAYPDGRILKTKRDALPGGVCGF
jgi:hypothetical protein